MKIAIYGSLIRTLITGGPNAGNNPTGQATSHTKAITTASVA
jgi:hypothetical protein